MDWTQLMERPELLLMILAPVFFLCMVAEYWFGQRRGRLPESAMYYIPEVVCNFVLAGLHQATDILTGLLIAQLYLWWFDWRLFDIEMSVSAFLLLVVLQDFFYYWFHRASHR
ncbi:sterol desaturase family protein, partial [Vibrio diabolicus]